MKTLVLALLALTFAAGDARADVPGRVTFTARLVNGTAPFDGAVQVNVQLFRAPAGGSSVWAESHATTAVAGLVAVALGDQDQLDANVVDGAPLYLEIAVNGTTLSPRLSIGSVPYALLAGRADTATKLGTLAEADVQRRVGGSCPAGSSISAIDAAGAVVCEADDTGITAVNPGSGISTSRSGSTVTVSVDATVQRRTATNMACPAGQYMRTIAATGATTCAPALTCIQRQGTASGPLTSVTCPTGHVVMGGGCSSPSNTPILDSYPSSTTSWLCRTTANSTIQPIAICCDVTF